MKCSLDRDKTKKAIYNTVLNRIDKTGLFNIDGESIKLKRILDNQPLTEEQRNIVDESLKYADEVKGAYKASFKNDPEKFLREIAEQANSSESEQGGALSVAGPKLFDLATSAFPDQGNILAGHRMIENINKEFKDDVIVPNGEDSYKIEPSSKLILSYIMTQKGSSEVLMEAYREHYLSQFSKDSLNLMQPEMWINHPVLEDPTIQKLIAFARKLNPNFRIGVVENLDQKAVALIRDYTILIRNGHIIDELPEEISHFFVELLPDDHQLKIDMMKDIVNYPIYSETFEKYKNNPLYQKDGKIDIDKIKREAVAKLVSQYIKDSWDNKLDKTLGKKKSAVKSFVDKIMYYLRKAISKITGNVYTEPLFDKKNPYQDAANTVLAENISDLNIKKIPNIHDSIFFSAIDSKIPISDIDEISKQAFQLSRAVGSQLRNIYAKKIANSKYLALKELLDDPVHKEYSRVFNIIDLIENAKLYIDESNNLSPDLAEEVKKTQQYKAIHDASLRLAEAYREMYIIPEAINSILDNVERDISQNKTTPETKFLDNIQELQQYFQFSNSFDNISNSFIKLLTQVREDFRGTQYDAQGMYNSMLENMNKTRASFEVANGRIMKLLQSHVHGLMVKWTEQAFEKYRSEIMKNYGEAKFESTKADLLKRLTDKITSPEQLQQAIMGKFPTLEEAKARGINLAKIKDASQMDYLIALFSSATLTEDPFISNLMAHYTDKYVAGLVRGRRNAIVFADKILPIKAELQKQGVGYYAAELLIQDEEDFYDPYLETKKTRKRVLLSQTNRHKFNYDLQIIEVNIDKLRSELRDLQSKKADISVIQEKQEEYTKALQDKEDFLEKYANRRYTDTYYEKIKALRANEKDSKILKKIKELKREALRIEEDQYIALAMDSQLSEPHYEILTEQLLKKQTEIGKLRSQLPEVDEKTYAIIEELYEEDKPRSSRLRIRHKTRWINNLKDNIKSLPGNTKSENQIVSELNDIYDNMYTVSKPNQKYYDKMEEYRKMLVAITGDTSDIKSINKTIEELNKKKGDILKNFKSVRNDNTVSSLKYDVNTAILLRDIEDEVSNLYNRLKIYTAIENAPDIGANEKITTKSYLDLLFAFNKTINYVNLPINKIIDVFESTINLTNSEADIIKNAIDLARKGDNSGIESLKATPFSFVNNNSKIAFNKLMLYVTDLASFINIDESVSNVINNSRKEHINWDSFNDILGKMNSMNAKSVSFDYLIVLSEFANYAALYVKNSQVVPQIHKTKVENFTRDNLFTIESIEDFFGDGLFDNTLAYIQSMIDSGQTSTESGQYSLSEYLDYIQAIHRVKTIKNQNTHTYSPVNYVRELVVDKEFSDLKYPKFLTRNKVKDDFENEKITELDPRVKSGKAEATVDINGKWLPKANQSTDSPYYSKRYHDLKNGTDTVSKNAFKLLTIMTDEYLTAQMNSSMDDGERLDTVIPAKYLDHLEGTKQDFTNAKELLNKVRNLTGAKGANEGIEEELQDSQENLGVLSVENRNIYSGALIDEDKVKLSSRRRIPIQRASKDATASIANFIEEIEEYEAKNMVSPIFKTFRDVMKNAFETSAGTSNKYRSEVLNDLYLTKILDQAPKNFANNPYVAGALGLMSKFATLRLLGDPLGAMVNLASGTMQSLIEAAFDKKEYQAYLSSAGKAASWIVKYDKDFYNQSNWSKETQIINIFNMIPESMSIAKHLSKQALASDIKSKLMAPRSESEKLLAIHLGLGILLSNPVEFQGSFYNIDDLYTTDPTTNLVVLKPEFKSLENEWNPEDGTQVLKLRRKIMQKYTLLQGNFYKINQSYASETAIGRAGELMKRWFVSGLIRRFQGEVIDPFTGDPRKGYHLAMMHLIWKIIKTLPTGNIAELNDYWTNIANGLESEKIAIRRSASELLAVLAFGIMTIFVLGYDSDDPDKNKKLKEATIWKQWAILLSMRIQGELGTFIPVPVWGLGYMEMKRAILDPFGIVTTSGFNNVAAVFKLLFMQALYGIGVNSYEKDLFYSKDLGYNSDFNQMIGFRQKGGSKLWSMILNTIGYVGYNTDPVPYINTVNNMQNRVK